jgi:hypothetical protein
MDRLFRLVISVVVQVGAVFGVVVRDVPVIELALCRTVIDDRALAQGEQPVLAGRAGPFRVRYRGLLRIGSLGRLRRVMWVGLGVSR